jgi:hypothetical protein
MHNPRVGNAQSSDPGTQEDNMLPMFAVLYLRWLATPVGCAWLCWGLAAIVDHLNARPVGNAGHLNSP